MTTNPAISPLSWSAVLTFFSWCPRARHAALLDEFRQSLQGRSVTYLEGRCLSYGGTTPYLPILDLLRHHCGITDVDRPEAITTKVYRALQEVGMDPDAGGPLLLHLLGAPAGLERLPLLTPEVIKRRTFATLQQLSLNSSRQGPRLLAVEDLHWIDATSEEWLVSLVDRLANAPLLLLTTYRPGYRPLWVDKSYATQMALPRLTRQESQSVVQSALHSAPIADALLQAILERGEVWGKALLYFRQAGEKAMARSAHREAVGSFEQALSALPHLPETRGYTWPNSVSRGRHHRGGEDLDVENHAHLLPLPSKEGLENMGAR